MGWRSTSMAGRRSGNRLGRPEAAADLADGLLQALRILDERETQVALAGFAEATAGADGHVGLFQELHGEIDRAHPGLPGLGHGRPGEHPRPGGLGLPADAPE